MKIRGSFFNSVKTNDLKQRMCDLCWENMPIGMMYVRFKNPMDDYRHACKMCLESFLEAIKEEE